MNRENYKPVHSLIKSGIRNRLALVAHGDGERSTFSVRIGDLSELKHDLAKPLLNVVAAATRPGQCEVRSYLRLGPSDRSRQVLLSSIFVKSKKIFIPPFRKVVAITINGADAATGEKVSRVYSAP